MLVLQPRISPTLKNTISPITCSCVTHPSSFPRQTFQCQLTDVQISMSRWAPSLSTVQGKLCPMLPNVVLLLPRTITNSTTHNTIIMFDLTSDLSFYLKSFKFYLLLAIQYDFQPCLPFCNIYYLYYYNSLLVSQVSSNYLRIPRHKIQP